MKRRDFLKAGVIGISTAAITDNAMGLEFYPRSSDKKWAVLYGTWCGSSRDAGVWISEGMGGIADVFDVRENPDLKKFDHVVIGGSIRGAVTPKALQKFITGNIDWLQPKIRGLFAVCGNLEKPVGPEQTTRFIDEHLARLCKVQNLPSRVFNGRITKSLMTPGILKIMEKGYPEWTGGKPLRDYDFLKRSECMTFGRQIAGI